MATDKNARKSSEDLTFEPALLEDDDLNGERPQNLRGKTMQNY